MICVLCFVFVMVFGIFIEELCIKDLNWNKSLIYQENLGNINCSIYVVQALSNLEILNDMKAYKVKHILFLCTWMQRFL